MRSDSADPAAWGRIDHEKRPVPMILGRAVMPGQSACAPSGTRTPNPLIKRQIHPKSDLREPLRGNDCVSVSVCSRLPLSAPVAVKFSCQTRYPIARSGGVLSSALLVEAAGLSSGPLVEAAGR